METDAERFAAEVLKCPRCATRLRSGQGVRIAARFCLKCDRCQHHCECGPDQELRGYPPLQPPLVAGGDASNDRV